MKKKLLIIGAGSAMFTQGLVADLIKRQPGGHKWAVALCDTDAKVLEGVRRLIQKMLDARGLDVELTADTDRRQLLPGADYVISTIGVGGRRAWEQDVLIPRKYGIYQPVGDTAMPGGISRAMRMVPAMVDIVNDTKKLAPTARFFNYSNPMAVICRALSKAVDFPVTGLCIGTVESEWHIADYMGYERERFTTLAAGINHCTFLYDFRYEGRDVKEEIISRARQDYGESAIANLPDPFAWEVLLKYGIFPAPGDRHITEFFTEYFPGGAYYGKRLGVDAYSFEGTIEMGDRIHDAAMTAAFSDAPLDKTFFDHIHGEHEQLISIIDSIERDAREIYYVNLPNGGAISNLPPWAVVERPAAMGATGAMPLILNGFPDSAASFTNRFLAGVETTVDAALRGDRRLMEEAIMMGGCISDKSAVRKMTDELLMTQRHYLPQF